MKRSLTISLAGIVGLAVVIAGVRWWRSTDDGPQRHVYAAFTLVAPTEVSGSQLVARVLIDATGGCPRIDAVGAEGSFAIDMTPRLPGPNAAPVFSTVLACSASLPTGLDSATIVARFARPQ